MIWFALYIASIVAANWAIQTFGIVPIGFGLYAPAGFLDESPFTDSGKRKAIGNAVPVPMGRAIARAVRRALGLPIVSSEASA